MPNFLLADTSKSLSDANILGSTNPQYKRLFIDLPVQYMKITTQNMLCTQIVCFCFGIQNN